MAVISMMPTKLLLKKNVNPIFKIDTKQIKGKLYSSVIFFPFADNKTNKTSNYLFKLLQCFQSVDNFFLFRFVSTTKQFINNITEHLSLYQINHFVHPVYLGCNALVAYSDNLQSLNCILSYWGSSDMFNIFIIKQNNLNIFNDLLTKENRKNRKDIFTYLVNNSELLFNKSGDTDELEIISKNFDYDFIHKKLSLFCNENHFEFSF